MGNLKTWLNGVIGAAIGAAANGITVIILDPATFSPTADGGWKHLGIAVGVFALVGAALFLKTHPTPWDGTIDRRNGNAGNVAPLVDRRNAQALGVPGVPQEPPAQANPIIAGAESSAPDPAAPIVDRRKSQGGNPTNGG